jgi:acetylornithine deacetylase/succinyl-diaminopimelate desuccinylase-like protein
MALVRLLATLHDDKGDIAVADLIRDDKYPFAPVNEKQFCINAGVRPGISLIGTGSLAERLGGRPSINVVGLDGVNSIAGAANVLCPKETARISVRLSPSQKPEQARQAIEEHLNNVRPWGIQSHVTFLGSAQASWLTRTVSTPRPAEDQPPVRRGVVGVRSPGAASTAPTKASARTN